MIFWIFSEFSCTCSSLGKFQIYSKQLNFTSSCMVSKDNCQIRIDWTMGSWSSSSIKRDILPRLQPISFIWAFTKPILIYNKPIKCTSPSNEFLLHACGQTDKRTYIYPPLDEHYSPIISTICGPNKLKVLETIYSMQKLSRHLRKQHIF